MRLGFVLCLFTVSALAQTGSPQAAFAANPQVMSSRMFYEYMKGNITKTAKMVPEDKYSYRASKEVRTMGEILAHVADAQYAFCGMMKDGKAVTKDVEKTAKTKADIVAAVTDSFALCDAAWNALTDANSAVIVDFHGPKTKLAIATFNTAHGLEHYGNLVSYMRLNGMVPPSSEAPPK